MAWVVYILYSQQLDRFYTGCTKKLTERLEQHQIHFYGKGAFTAKADDWELVFELPCRD